jgi:F-type H+-transporting ATPase subunit epsilon
MNNDTSQLQLSVVSQEREVLSTAVDSLTAITSEGEVTILPGHVPLFSQLVTGILLYRQGKDEHSMVISKGFLDVAPYNEVIIMVDSAVAARDISEQKAEEAIEAARETMLNSTDRQELIMAEASLKRAMLELKVAQKSKKNKI